MGKIIKSIVNNTFEAVKDSVKQVGNTVSPGAIIEQALGQRQQQSSEFTQYLKTVGKDLTPEELEKKKQEFSQNDQQQMEEARKKLLPTIPDHMKLPQKQREPRSYEAVLQEQERKKAQEVEMQKRQSQQMAQPTSKQARGSLFAKKKKAHQSGFETMKGDKKAG